MNKRRALEAKRRVLSRFLARIDTDIATLRCLGIDDTRLCMYVLSRSRTKHHRMLLEVEEELRHANTVESC